MPLELKTQVSHWPCRIALEEGSGGSEFSSPSWEWIVITHKVTFLLPDCLEYCHEKTNLFNLK